MRLDALFRPKSIAIIGASEKPTIGRRLIASLERIGFAGPHGAEIEALIVTRIPGVTSLAMPPAAGWGGSLPRKR